jgi:osmotically-inducible protein OsmY
MKSEEKHKKEDITASVADSAVESGLKDAFGKDSGLKIHGLDLKVRHGEVTIDGKVADDAQRARAGAIAEKVKGVKAVDNKIMVGHLEKSPEKSADKGKIAGAAHAGKKSETDSVKNDPSGR